MLSGITLRSIIGIKVAEEASGMIFVYTRPPRFRRPKTGILPPAPRPRLPLRVPPQNRTHQLLSLPQIRLETLDPIDKLAP